MQALVAHQKQFVLGPEAVRVRPEWEALQLADRLILSLCPKLRVSRLRSRDGKDYYLLGLAIPADTPGSTVERGFPSKHSSEIEDWTGFWAGKWALISATQCWQDAAGLLGLYYRQTADGLWISSSPAILGGYLPNVEPAKRLPWRIAHEKGMDWIPAPLTTRENVFKLLALRTIEPVSGAIRPVRFSAAQSTETKDVRLLAATLKTVMGNWGEAAFRERTVGLTAGFDTRTVLAATTAAKVDFHAFTDVHELLARADHDLPPRLAAEVGVVHRFSDNPAIKEVDIRARQAAIIAHMDRAIFHPTAAMCVSGRADHMHDAGLTIAAGHGFEIGRCAHWARFFRSGLTERAPTRRQPAAIVLQRAPEVPVAVDGRHDHLAALAHRSDPARSRLARPLLSGAAIRRLGIDGAAHPRRAGRHLLLSGELPVDRASAAAIQPARAAHWALRSARRSASWLRRSRKYRSIRSRSGLASGGGSPYTCLVTKRAVLMMPVPNPFKSDAGNETAPT